MAPKKKGGKKQADDWEADLGETVDPIAQATEDAKQAEKDAEAGDGDMNGASGGLLAALRKNKDKRAKKGKPVANDFVDGEDPDGAAPTPPVTDLDSKAPAEATFDDDDDDVFAGNAKKDKGGKKQPEKAAEPDDDGENAAGGLKSKKEKEREKKEREKQRKKEQACHPSYADVYWYTDNHQGC